MKTDRKCQVDTYRGAGMIVSVGYYSPCGKPATVLLPNGEWVCRYHSPEAKAKREERIEEQRLIRELNRRKGFGRRQRTV